MYNRAVLMGRICNDLELKTTPSGATVLSFRIAVERSYQAKGEERKTDFFNVVAWRVQADFISKYFSKGRMILVEGELQTRQYTDKNGAVQNVVELIVDNVRFTGESKQNSGQTTSIPSAPSTPQPMAKNANVRVDTTPTDDDYPF